MRCKLLVVSAIAALVAAGCASSKKTTTASAPPLVERYSDFEPDTQPWQLGKTWVEIDGVIYGAKPNELGPIGGAFGYKKIVTSGDFVTTTVQGVMDALAKAKPGQTVFLPGNAVLDMTAWIIADKKTIDVPAGVTLAGDRGAGNSFGAMIFSTEMHTQPMIRVLGEGARITGLRLRGPDPLGRRDHYFRSYHQGGGRELYYAMPNSDGIMATASHLEIDNCEIMGWSNGGINLARGKDHRIHHNYFHHCRRQGLGYGIVINRSFSAIEYNLFDYCRHYIAGTGAPGSGYEAANNVTLLNSSSHLFDMHGGRDRKDGTTIAGTYIKVHHNTFMHPTERILYIRGIPQEVAEFHHNWVYRNYDEAKKSTLVDSDGKTSARDNVYGNPPQKAEERYSFEK